MPRRAASRAALAAGLATGALLFWAFGFVWIWTAGFLHNDFSAIWAGPHLLVMGGDPYDPNTFVRASDALGAQHSATAVYIYPGWVAVLLAPLGALDRVSANVVWMAISVAVASIGLFALLDAGPRHPFISALLGFTLLASESAIVALYSGQTDHVLLGGLALSMAWLASGRQVAAGVAASAMLLKPQLFTLAIPALVALALARGQRRFAYALIASALAIAVTSTLVLPHWWSAWFEHVLNIRLNDVRASTLANALRDTFGSGGLFIAYALLAGSVAAAAAFGRSSAAIPAWLTVSMSVAPYHFVYDHIVGIVPLAMAVAQNAERDMRAAIAIALAGALILVVAATLLHAIPGNAAGTLSFNGLAQFAMTVLIIGSLWRFRSEPGA